LLTELKLRLQEIQDLTMTRYVLAWDQATYMPIGGSIARGRQIATLAQLTQEKAIDVEIGRLLDALQPYADRLPYDSDEASLVRVARYDYEKATRVPPEFTARFYNHLAEIYNVWTQARPANDFARVRPLLEKSLDLSRELADFFPGYEHIADPLIDRNDPGMKVSLIQPLFSTLRRALLPLVQAITSRPPADDTCLRIFYPEQEQLKFSEFVISQIGFDFQRGRQDLSPHPFTVSFSPSDVRITTRVRTDFLGETFFSSVHEAGHAMYEQGVKIELDGTPLGQGASSGIHESQSRLWENLVGRSLPFWEYFYPRLQHNFPTQLGDVPFESFYKAINKVERSLIRTDADEVTYNLHVMLRLDLELALLEGRLEVRHLPEAWNARYESDLGISPLNDRDGCLQDAHWFDGTIGGQFQGYTLGNILSAQFYSQALAEHPDIPDQIRAGQFSELLNWLRKNIYQHGRKFFASELVQRLTGGPIRIEPYIDYLQQKYTRLYTL
jgi:carboxypeptidase Taq